jgi:hypothetical protein
MSSRATNQLDTLVPGEGVICADYYQPNTREKIQALWEGLALRFSRKPILVVGPYVGEFGHEIMRFQGFVRWFKRKYREVYVITYPGREPLYRGCVVHSHRFDLRAAGYGYGRMPHSEIRHYARDFARARQIENYDLFSTAHLQTGWRWQRLFQQEHEIIGPRQVIPPSQKVVFHFRSIDKAGSDKTRNFRPDLAQAVCDLCRERGWQIACIGHPEYSLCPNGCEDCRSEDLEQTVASIAASRLVAGELSGPLHLAAYGGRPVLTWAPGEERIGCARKWNPFNVQIFVVRNDTTNPPPDEIVSKLREALAVLDRLSEDNRRRGLGFEHINVTEEKLLMELKAHENDQRLF